MESSSPTSESVPSSAYTRRRYLGLKLAWIKRLHPHYGKKLFILASTALEIEELLAGSFHWLLEFCRGLLFEKVSDFQVSHMKGVVEAVIRVFERNEALLAWLLQPELLVAHGELLTLMLQFFGTVEFSFNVCELLSYDDYLALFAGDEQKAKYEKEAQLRAIFRDPALVVLSMASDHKSTTVKCPAVTSTFLLDLAPEAMDACGGFHFLLPSGLSKTLESVGPMEKLEASLVKYLRALVAEKQLVAATSGGSPRFVTFEEFEALRDSFYALRDSHYALQCSVAGLQQFVYPSVAREVTRQLDCSLAGGWWIWTGNLTRSDRCKVTGLEAIPSTEFFGRMKPLSEAHYEALVTDFYGVLSSPQSPPLYLRSSFFIFTNENGNTVDPNYVNWLDVASTLTRESWDQILLETRERLDSAKQQAKEKGLSQVETKAETTQHPTESFETLPVSPKKCQYLIDLHILYQAGNHAIHQTKHRLEWKDFLTVLNSTFADSNRAFRLAKLAAQLSSSILYRYDDFLLDKRTIPSVITFSGASSDSASSSGAASSSSR